MSANTLLLFISSGNYYFCVRRCSTVIAAPRSQLRCALVYHTWAVCTPWSPLVSRPHYWERLNKGSTRLSGKHSIMSNAADNVWSARLFFNCKPFPVKTQKTSHGPLLFAPMADDVEAPGTFYQHPVTSSVGLVSHALYSSFPGDLSP